MKEQVQLLSEGPQPSALYCASPYKLGHAQPSPWRANCSTLNEAPSMNAVAETRLASAAKESVESPALVVDLDGTLVKTDLLLEAVLVLLKQKLYYAFRLLLWLMKGKAYFKRQVARQVSLDVAVLPYREEVLDYLREQRAHGRKLVLATGSDIQIARLVADH